MLQTLFYIPEKIADIPVFGWGLLLWAWLLFSIIVMLGNFLRSGINSSEAWGFLPVAAVGSFAIYKLLPALVQPEFGLPIRGFGVMLLLAVVCGVGVTIYRAWQMGVDPELIYSLSFWMFLAGLIGARLFYVIEYRERFIRPNLMDSLAAIINVPEGGIVVYGAFFGGLLAATLFLYCYKFPFLAIVDLLLPGMALGGAIGRIGCLMNGCCFGGLCEPPYPAVTFPIATVPYMAHAESGLLWGLKLREADSRVVVAAVLPNSPAEKAGILAGDSIAAFNAKSVSQVSDLHFPTPGMKIQEVELRLQNGAIKRLHSTWPERSLPVHPTQIYDAINLALLAAVLWFYYPLRRRDGEVLAIALTLYSLSRYVLEIIRVDEPSQLGTNLSISQLISLGLFALIIPFWIYLETRRQPPLLPWNSPKIATS